MPKNQRKCQKSLGLTVCQKKNFAVFFSAPKTPYLCVPFINGQLNNAGDHRNNYELMVIFTPVLSEEDYKAAQKKYAALVKDNGGSILARQHPWGLKSLAYPGSRKKTTGLALDARNALRHPTSTRSSTSRSVATNHCAALHGCKTR